MSDEVKISVNAVELGPCSMKLEFEVPAAIADKSYRKVLQRYASQVKIPGFRSGHVPQKILLENYGANITADATGDIIQNAYKEVAENYRKDMAGEPAMTEDTQNVLYVAGQPLKFALVYDVKPKITLPEYKGLHLTREKKEVTQEQIDAALKGIQEQSAKYEVVEGPTIAEDFLTVAHTAEPVDGKEKPENKYHQLDAEKTWVALRKPEMYPGIAESLLGMKANEERDVEITYPEDYREEIFRGRKFKYHFTVKEIRRAVKSELNDEFAKSQGFESMEKMTDFVKKSLEQRIAQEAKQALVKQVSDLLFANLTFDLPPTQLENVTRDILRQKIEDSKRQGVEGEAVKEKLEEMRKEARTAAEKELREIYLLNELAAAENIQVSQQDMMQYQMMLQQQKGKRPMGNVIREKQQSGELQNFMMNRVFEHLFDFIIEKAEVVDAEPAK